MEYDYEVVGNVGLPQLHKFSIWRKEKKLKSMGPCHTFYTAGSTP
ncbi:unnamed protein product [Brassica oleracea var. botrytis]